jgi:hypothetical protein
LANYHRFQSMFMKAVDLVKLTGLFGVVDAHLLLQ